MENRSNNLFVGTVTLVLFFATAGFIIWLANFGSTSRTEYDIFFKQSVAGLAKGANVLFTGVPVGEVSDIALWRPDPQFVRVRIEINKDIPVLRGTTATIQGVGFTGVSEIQLEGAVKGAPPITDIGPAGRPVIPTKRGGLGELLNNAPRLLERLSELTERLTELADDRNQRSLANTLANLDKFTGALAQNGPEVQRTLADTRHAVQQAANAAEQISNLASTTNGLLNDQGRPMIADLRRAVGSAEQSIASLQSAIDTARPGLQNFSTRTIPEANALIRDLRHAATTLSGVADRLDQQGAAGVISPRLPDYEPHR